MTAKPGGFGVVEVVDRSKRYRRYLGLLCKQLEKVLSGFSADWFLQIPQRTETPGKVAPVTLELAGAS